MHLQSRREKKRRVELQGNLGGPDPLDGLCETDVVCLEFVETDKNENGCDLEDSHESFPDAGDTVGREVIDDARPVVGREYVYVYAQEG